MRKEDKPIVVEQIYHASPKAVWNAITEIGQMRKWYFDNIPDFKPEIGFETQFNIQNEGRDFLHQWKITEVIPHSKIKYNWTYREYPGKAFVLFELTQKNDKTNLTLTLEVFEDFPQDIPEFKRESCIGGWNYFLKDRLKDYLNNL